MGIPADSLDLGGMRLTSGEGRRLELPLRIEPITLGNDTYTVDPQPISAGLDISCTTGDGYALRLRFDAALVGTCMRCLQPARASFTVEAREVSLPGDVDELDSPYVRHGILDLGSWGRDTLVLTLPQAILCRADCAGLCAVCGADLNHAESGHANEAQPDPRWAKLSEIRFDS
jgi:uncharacterized protein